MFSSFARLGLRDMKGLARSLHAMLAAGTPTDLQGCRDLVARLHGHASWQAARSLLGHTPAKAILDTLGMRIAGGRLSKPHPFRLDPVMCRAPRLLLGTSGSGRLTSLLGMFKAAIDAGMGGVFVEADGDPGSCIQLAAFAELAGRSQDLRIINLMGLAPGGVQRTNRNTHTFNPFEAATLADLDAWWLPLLAEQAAAAGSPLSDAASLRLRTELRQAVANHATAAPPLCLADLAGWCQPIPALRQALDVLAAEPAFARRMEAGPEGLAWRAADLDWDAALAGRQLVLVLLPALEKMPDVNRILGALLVRSLLHSLSRYPNAEHPHPRAMWVFDQPGRYMEVTDMERLVAFAPLRGIVPVLAAQDETQLCPRHVGADARRGILAACRLTLLMKQSTPTPASAWPQMGKHWDEVIGQHPGEAHVLLDGVPSGRVSLAYHAISSELLDDLFGGAWSLPPVQPRWRRTVRAAS